MLLPFFNTKNKTKQNKQTNKQKTKQKIYSKCRIQIHRNDSIVLFFVKINLKLINAAGFYYTSIKDLKGRWSLK